MGFPEFRDDHYYRYDELTAWLKGMEAACSGLMKLKSIGKSHEGRDIWLCEITNLATGPGEEKPGYWLDAQIHASEVCGCAVAMYTINRLLTGYSDEPDITALLDTRVLYVVPRMSPDGAEHVLTTGSYVRSSKRRYPFDDTPIEGLIQSDVDGDGEALQMRVEDPLGGWKVSEKDARLMLKRAPDERGGKYYRLYREGLFENYDGFNRKVDRSPYGLDLNRNFPYDWQQEYKQFGAGDLPLGEPETRAVAEFITSHRNISLALTLHTFSAVLLRPFSSFPDEHYPNLDLAVYKAIGKRCEELTGYPCVAVYHGFRYDMNETIRGTFDDWAYDHRGLVAYTMELWSILKQAGIEVTDHIAALRDRTEEQDLQLLKWQDENMGGEGFVPWRAFVHPQIGPVEIGGWRTLYTWTNPPPHMLAAECAKAYAFIVSQAFCTPRLILREFSQTELAPGLRKLTLIVTNDGFLPSNGTQMAIDHNLVRPMEVALELADGVSLVQGELRTEAGNLTGRANSEHQQWASSAFYGGASNAHEKRLEWVVGGEGRVEVTVRAERAGVVRASVQ